MHAKSVGFTNLSFKAFYPVRSDNSNQIARLFDYFDLTENCSSAVSAVWTRVSATQSRSGVRCPSAGSRPIGWGNRRL